MDDSVEQASLINVGVHKKARYDILTDKIAEISDYGITIYNLSNQYPIVYGVSSIFIALSAGIFVSYVRRQISKRINAPKAPPPPKAI